MAGWELLPDTLQGALMREPTLTSPPPLPPQRNARRELIVRAMMASKLWSRSLLHASFWSAAGRAWNATLLAQFP